MHFIAIFTFYNIYIKTYINYETITKINIFTFYNIYIKTATVTSSVLLLYLFTFYNIYIKTDKALLQQEVLFDLHSTIFILKLN